MTGTTAAWSARAAPVAIIARAIVARLPDPASDAALTALSISSFTSRPACLRPSSGYRLRHVLQTATARIAGRIKP